MRQEGQQPEQGTLGKGGNGRNRRRKAAPAGAVDPAPVAVTAAIPQQAAPVTEPEPQRELFRIGFDRAATLHLVTPGAGLVRWQSVLLQILRDLPQERHIVLMTGPTQDALALSQIAAAGGFALQPPADLAGEGDLWRWLSGRLDTLLPQRVMIHAAAGDALAERAAEHLAPRLGRRLYLLHGQGPEGGLVPGFARPELAGATHLLGPSVRTADLRGALRAAGHGGRLHLARLGLPFDPLENPVVEGAEAPVAPGAAAEGRGTGLFKSALRAVRTKLAAVSEAPAGVGKILTTASAAMPEELDRPGPDWLADLILSLVEATGGRHIHVGPIDPRLWHAVQLRLKEADLPPERVVFTGPEASVANALRHHRVDLFLGSLPGLVHCMGLAGAAWAGIAIARHTGAGEAGIGPDLTLDWQDPADLCARLQAAPDLRPLAEASQHWHSRRASAARFRRRLMAILDVTEGRLSAPITRAENLAALEALFDADYYLDRYPDIARVGIDPLRHYRKHGEAEGRSPNPLFQPWHYRAQLPEGAVGPKTSLLAHYLLRGEARGLTPHPYFVPASAAPDLPPHPVQAGGEDATGAARDRALSSVLARYLAGGTGMVRPHPLFDPAHYARALGFEAEAGPLLLHYLKTGAEEGLSPHPLIRPEMLGRWGAPKPLEGLLFWLGQPGARPGEPSPEPLFDPAYLCGDEAARYARAAPNMLWAHLIEGNRADRGPHPLIDPRHIAARRPEVLVAARPVLLDMVEGRMARIDSHPLISTAHLTAQAPWAGDHPTRHYLLRGTDENLDPHPWFSTAFYLSQSEEARASGTNALVHYLMRGQYDGLLPHPFFDGNDYWQRYLRGAAEGASPLIDYARRGAGRFRSVQPHDPAPRAAALRAAEGLFQQGAGPQASRLVAEALHPAEASPHPTLLTEIRPILPAPPAGVQGQEVLPAGHVALTRAAIVSTGHVAPPPLTAELPAVRRLVWPRAQVIGGADGIGTAAGGPEGAWWPQGPETGPLPGSALAQLGPEALRPDTPLAARRGDAVLIRRHGPALAFAEAIFACGSGSDSLDRFLIEVLPRAILAARGAAPGVPVLTEADLPAQARAALRLALPDHPVLELPRGMVAEVARLHLAEAVNRLEAPRDDAALAGKAPLPALQLHPATPDLLRGALRVPALPHPARRLFLGAGTALRRRLLNTEEMTAALARCGFLARDPDALDFAELVALVQGADEIVASDCAQLAVLALARPGTKVWVLQGNAPGTDHHRWDTLGRLAGLTMVAVQGWQVPGSAGLRARPAEAHFNVPTHLVAPFFETRLPQDRKAAALLDRLYGSAFEADVLTGAWAVAAGPTPAGFEARLAHLRGAAAAALLAADSAVLEPLWDHGFFTDFARNLRSGLPVVQDFSEAEQALIARLRPALAALAAGDAVTDEDFTGATGARRLILLAMLLIPAWSAPLPEAAVDETAQGAALSAPVLERWIAWAMAPPALIRAGEDAAWLAHVERLLNWLADRLDPTTEAGAALPPALALRLARLAGRIDLGQLFLIDQPLRGVQAARNRILERIALKEGAEQAALPTPIPGRRIRIGLLCRTFDKGPDSEAVLTFFAGFDPARYEIFAYSIGFRDRVVSKDPAFDRRFDAVVPHRRDLPADPAGIRAALLADRLDVFLYANATTYGLQPMDLALYHPVAPHQAVLNSHVPMPMGYPSFQAVLTGRSDDPAHEVPQADFAERLIRCPGPVINYLTTLEPRPNPPLTRAALGLAPGDVVLMNAGSSMKLRHETLATMMRAVRDIPDGVLLLAPYNPGWAARSMAFVFNRQLAEVAAETGLDPARIRVLGELSVAEAEAALGCADLYLNPFPHGGATMTHLALVHGVPPVTLRRRSTRSIDQFLVETHGFAELLADTPEDYIALARALGTDPARRAEIKARLKAAAKNPAFVNNPDFSKNMQQAIEALLHQGHPL